LYSKKIFPALIGAVKAVSVLEWLARDLQRNAPAAIEAGLPKIWSAPSSNAIIFPS
jgi:hypothetical protein